MKKITTILLLLSLLSIPQLSQAQIGDKVKNFSLKNVKDDKTYSLNDYQSYTCLVLVFTSVYCPYSKYYEERIKDLASRYQESDETVRFVMINASPQRDSPEDMKKAAETYGLDYLIDENVNLAKTLGASKMPEVFVLMKQMGEHFIIKYHGAIDDSPQMAKDVKQSYLQQAIESVLASKLTTMTSQAPVGCKIKIK